MRMKKKIYNKKLYNKKLIVENKEENLNSETMEQKSYKPKKKKNY